MVQEPSPSPTSKRPFPVWTVVLVVSAVALAAVVFAMTKGSGSNSTNNEPGNANGTTNANASANANTSSNANATTNTNTASHPDWLTYTNASVGYELSYPPDATISEDAAQGVARCVTVTGSRWLMMIHAANDPTSSVCGRSGVGAGDLSHVDAALTIAGTAYTATVLEIDAANRYDNHDKWLEVKDLTIGNGIRKITGEGRDTPSDPVLQNYLDSEPTLMEVIESIRSL
jgi:hypothetical protein